MILLGRTHGLNTASVPSYKSLMSAQDLCSLSGELHKPVMAECGAGLWRLILSLL